MNNEKQEIKEEISYPTVTLADLPESLQAAVDRAGWSKLMPVQATTLPYHFARKDLMVQSRTGSGKTGSFLLPLIETLNPLLNQCQALILTPTRELAQQIVDEANVLIGQDGRLRTVAVYGGVSYGPQLDAFKKGAHIVIGTPGRIIDHLIKRNLSLDHLTTLIFDEADRMLSMGFFQDMMEIKRYMPRGSVNTNMYSATFPPNVLRLARQFLYEPKLLSLSTDHVHVIDTTHIMCKVEDRDKDRGLIRLIEFENPTSAIIFCNTRVKVEYVATVLTRFGYDAAALSSDLSQKEREKVIRKLRKGSLRFLVATDVASRGIDIPELSHVFQYEPPEDPELYIHRAGRTGRAGATGKAIILVGLLESLKLKQIARQYKIEFEEISLPTEEELADLVGERLVVMLEAHLRLRDRLQIERMQRFIPLAKSLSESEEGLNLLSILMDDYYQLKQHEVLLPIEEAEEENKPAPKKKRPRNRNKNKKRN